MAFKKSDNKAAETHLKDNGFKPLQSSPGFSNGSVTVKVSPSGGSWTDSTGTKTTTLSDFKKKY